MRSRTTSLTQASKNALGEFIKADRTSVTAAASAVSTNMPSHFRVSITNAPGSGAYPISTFTWLLVPSIGRSAAEHRALLSLVRWMLTDGQQMVESLSYVPLPKETVAKELQVLQQLK